MSVDEAWLVLALRIVSSVALFGFIGLIGWLIWRDYRQLEQVLHEQKRQRGRLLLLDNFTEGVTHSFPLLPLTTIGRAPGNTIQLNEPYISSEHAVISWRDGQWWLEDLNSSNGTRLNEHRLTEATVISAADEIGLGDIRLRLELE